MTPHSIQTVVWFLRGHKDEHIKSLRSISSQTIKAVREAEEQKVTAKELFRKASASLDALQAAQNPGIKHMKLWGVGYASQKDWASLRIQGPVIPTEKHLADMSHIEVFGELPYHGVYGMPHASSKADPEKAWYTFVTFQRLDSMPKDYQPTGPGYPYLVNFVYFLAEGPVKIQWACTIDTKGKVFPPRCVVHTQSLIRKYYDTRQIVNKATRIYDPIAELNKIEEVSGLNSAQLVAVAVNFMQYVDLNVTVRVSDRRGVVNMSIALEDAKRIFSGREKVKTPSGSTKRILHWVKSHRRRNGQNVKTHWRGLRSFRWMEMDVEIYMPGKHLPLMTRTESLLESGTGWINRLFGPKPTIVKNPFSSEEVEVILTDKGKLQAQYYTNTTVH